MFVGHVSEDDRGVRKLSDRGKRGYEGKTSSELYRLMNIDRQFQTTEETTSTRDLVFLYKNLDLGNNLMSNSKEMTRKVPNQRVETIVYEECDSDSDLSEIYSNEDLHNILIINKQRIDQLNHGTNQINPSRLCHKFRELEIHASNVKLDSVDSFSISNNMIPWELPLTTYESPLSDSLNEYMQCKHLQGNYNISMDNVIHYVNHTIGQLKRISNGDYLTEKVKEKWKESDGVNTKIEQKKPPKALVASTNNGPKLKQCITKSNAVIQSDVDIQMTNIITKTLKKKIRNKKIEIQVSPPLSETLKLLNVYRPDNLVITCRTKEKNEVNKEESSEKRIDVTLQLNQPKTAYIVNSISTTATAQIPGNITVLSLPYKNDDHSINSNTIKEIANDEFPNKLSEVVNQEDDEEADENENLAFWACDNESQDERDGGINVESVAEEYESDIESDIKLSVPTVAPELQTVMQRQMPLPEKSIEDVPSPVSTGPKLKTRSMKTKSPYENKSHVLEEKRRKRLLEIKQKREKVKQSMAENLKVNKSQFSRVNSITKLSISNKSFYDSVFGQSVNGNLDEDPKSERLDKAIELTKSEESSTYSGSIKDEGTQSEFLMHLDIKHKRTGQPKSKCRLGSPNKKSAVVIQKIPQTTAPSEDVAPSGRMKRYENKNGSKSVEATSQLAEPRNPTNTPKTVEKVLNKAQSTEDDRKHHPSVEFRKSIDKIYELINKRAKSVVPETRRKSKFTAVASATCKLKPSVVMSPAAPVPPPSVAVSACDGSEPCTISGTSLKHRSTSSNISLFGSDKTNEINALAEIIKTNNQNKKAPNIEPKVIISTKSKGQKSTEGLNKYDHRKISVNTQNTPSNPLKAISQLIHEFDNVRKSRKLLHAKPSKRDDLTVLDVENEKRKPTKKNVRADLTEAAEKSDLNKSPLIRVKTPVSSTLPKHKAVEEKSIIRKINADATDEMLEARGEAVRGPSTKQGVRFNCKKVSDACEEILQSKGEVAQTAFRLNARWNSLAQPKKAYIRTQDEDNHMRYRRNLATNRLQRLNASGSDLPTRARFPSLPNRLTPGSTSNPDKLQRKPPDGFKDKMQKKLPDGLIRKHKIQFEENLLKPSLEVESASDTSNLKSHLLRDSNSASLSNNESCVVNTSKTSILTLDFEVDSLTSTVEDDGSIVKNTVHQTISNNMVTEHRGTVLSNSSISFDPSFQSYREGNQGLTKNGIFTNNQEVCSDVISAFGNGDSSAKHQLETLSEVDTVDGEANQDDRIDIKNYNSVTTLKTLKNAICATISVSTLKKPFTVQNISYFQSGDSLVLNSEMNTFDHKVVKQRLGELTRLEWPVMQFPIKFTTVGFAFPKFYWEVNQLKPPELRTSSSLPDNNAQPWSNTSVTQIFHIGPSILNDDDHALSSKEESKLAKVELEQILPVANEEKQDDSSSSTDNSVVTFISRLKSNLAIKESSTDNEFTKTNDGERREQSEISEEVWSDEREEELKKCDDIDTSSSLDVLVKLLCEIQKITCSHSQIATPSLDIETSDTSVLDTESHDIISLTSLEKLRLLESRTSSLFSICVSENSGDVDVENMYDERVLNRNFMSLTPVYSNERMEVGVQVKELLPKWSEAPLIIFPSKRDHATHVTNSLIGVLSERSSASSSAIDFESNNITSVRPVKNVVTSKSQHLAIQPYRCTANTRIAVRNAVIETKPTTTNMKRVNKNHPQILSANTKIKAKEVETVSINNNQNNKHIEELSINKYSADPIINFKRDILVTVYSVLVFTVFAALSIPELFYRL